MPKDYINTDLAQTKGRLDEMKGKMSVWTVLHLLTGER